MATNPPDIALGFEDEVWWSREAQPQLHAWSADAPVRLVEQTVPRKAPEGTAIACDGLSIPAANQLLLRFVPGRPVSAVTCAFLAWLALAFAAQGKRALVLIGDNASWHIRQAVRVWSKAHTREAKHTGGCRVVMCRLPSKSPWLNPLEPKWVHGKRAILDPTRLLSMTELMQRVCAYYPCELTAPIAQADC